MAAREPVRPETAKKLKPISEDDKPNLKYLLSLLSDRSNLIQSAKANFLLAWWIQDYIRRGIGTEVLEGELSLRSQDMPYLRKKGNIYPVQ